MWSPPGSMSILANATCGLMVSLLVSSASASGSASRRRPSPCRPARPAADRPRERRWRRQRRRRRRPKWSRPNRLCAAPKGDTAHIANKKRKPEKILNLVTKSYLQRTNVSLVRSAIPFYYKEVNQVILSKRILVMEWPNLPFVHFPFQPKRIHHLDIENST